MTGKLFNLREIISSKISNNELFCSFEVISVKEDNEKYKRFFTETIKYSPVFYSVTWHTTIAHNYHGYLEAMKYFPENTLLHLAVKGLKNDDVETILKSALKHGITSIFALQGDIDSEEGDFSHAVNLVTFIRNRFGIKFSIGVAGYPQMHPKSSSKELDLFYLKEKVDAGADFIITQFFFESEVFINFVNDCRRIGINVPIIPGIFTISHYEYLERMVNMCKVQVPTTILHQLQIIKNNRDVVRNFGVKLTTDLIKDIIKSGTACGFHFFTFNRSPLLADICNQLGF